jgi:hypothetical protein
LQICGDLRTAVLVAGATSFGQELCYDFRTMWITILISSVLTVVFLAVVVWIRAGTGSAPPLERPVGPQQPTWSGGSPGGGWSPMGPKSPYGEHMAYRENPHRQQARNSPLPYNPQHAPSLPAPARPAIRASSNRASGNPIVTSFGVLIGIFGLDVGTLWTLNKIAGGNLQADAKATINRFGGSIAIAGFGLMGCFLALAIISFLGIWMLVTIGSKLQGKANKR